MLQRLNDEADLFNCSARRHFRGSSEGQVLWVTGVVGFYTWGVDSYRTLLPWYLYPALAALALCLPVALMGHLPIVVASLI